MINEGVNKRGWYFTTGAYVTALRSCRFNICQCLGQSTANGVTTLLFDCCDGSSIDANYTNSITVIGGAFQGATNTKFKFRNGCDFWLKTDVEGGGVFLDVDNTVNGLWSFVQLQGFSGTYQSGTLAPATFQFDQQTSYNAYPWSLGVGGFRLNSQGSAGNSSWTSGNDGSNYYLNIGRTRQDAMIGVAAATNDFVGGTVAGDVVVAGWRSDIGNSLFIAAGQVVVAKATTTGFNTIGTGQLECGQIVLQPAADSADRLVIKNAAGTGLIDVSTNATPSSSKIELASGIDMIGYTDNFSTQAYKINAATGQINAGAQLYPGGGNSGSPVVNTAAGILAGIGAPSSSLGNIGDFYLRGDGTHGSSNCIYHKESGGWVGLI